MAESKTRRRLPKALKDVHGLPKNFYGALKSKHEIYFQMASLFQEVTKDEKKLAHKWMELVLRSNPSDSSGKFFLNHI